MKKKIKVNGLRRRWILNSVAPVLALLVLIGTFLSLIVGSSFYENARTTLETKAKAGADYFNTYVMTSYAEYYRSATLYVNSFDDSDRIEIQFLNNSGRIETSSRGLLAGTAPGTSDIAQSIEQGTVCSYTGKDPVTGERIISISSPLEFGGKIVGAMRYVTSTKNIDHQITIAILVIAVVTLGIVFLLLVSSIIFINNVISPVAEVADAAKRISNGSYGVQITNHYSDEMGEMVDNINDMSAKLSQSEKMETEFISSVSHELRTPLTAINGWGETLLSDDSGDIHQLRRGVQIILKESKRLTNMVEELLEFSKIEDGRFTLQVEEMDLQAEFEDTIFTYRELFSQEGIELSYGSGEELYNERFYGDPERLKQVFCNVLDNAAKHGGSGKKIDTYFELRDDDFVITVRDYGPGIPEAELPYVKQKFYKGSSKARGSGIGLAVCEEIVTLHNGTFTICNAEGGGAVVTIELPISKTEEI